MRCYYHSEREVVAVCKVCNKNLCKECYNNGELGRCHQCGDVYKRKQVGNAKTKDVIKSINYIKWALIFLCLGILIGYLTYDTIVVTVELEFSPKVAFVLVIAAFGYLGLSLHCGISILSKIFKSVLNMGLMLWIYVNILDKILGFFNKITPSLTIQT